MIAAYGVVVGALIAYGLWVRAQRRALERELATTDRAPDATPAGSGDG